MDNYQSVLLQMEEFGIELRDKDVPLRIDTPKKITCGAKGKDWYRLYTFQRDSGDSYITGSFGTYRHGGDWRKVLVDYQPLSDAERGRMAAERAAAKARARAEREQEIANAAAEAIDIWRKAARTGESEYLERKDVTGEACRYLAEQMVLRWAGRKQGDDDTIVRLPAGTLVLPLVRYDMPQADALRGLQFIRPDGAKIYLRGFEKPGCALRLGDVDTDWTVLALICEGYATGLTLRMATDYKIPVFVAWDAGNLAHVVPLLSKTFRTLRLLVCADDDWKTADRDTGELTNPGRTAARNIARATVGCDILWPQFNRKTRQDKDTDFNDLHAREGIDAVRAQISGVVSAMSRRYG
jgi:putative DNA primase/helicase